MARDASRDFVQLVSLGASSAMYVELRTVRSGDEVHVIVENRLTGRRPVELKHRDPVGLQAPSHGLRQLPRHGYHSPRSSVGNLEQVLPVRLGDDERMTDRDREQIHEHQRMLVFPDFMGARAAGNDPAEDTFVVNVHDRVPSPMIASPR
jgi:hypothetical protein